MNIFEKYLIAHLVGDYLLQNNWMALGKSKKIRPLTVHSGIYGLVFGLAFQSVDVFLWIMAIHFLLDTSWNGATISEWWLRLIRGRSLKLAITPPTDKLCSASPNVKALYVAFTPLIYCIVDFLLHFAIQYPLIILVSS